ncbi:hypothetical protein BH24DEI1_BH24DEI1_01840 [soil metagenome]|nr:hypothetical protein [Deinococcota bacterium]
MIWFGVALVVVAVAALLLIWIWLEARGIAHEAQRALAAGWEVEARTRALWAIPQVNQLLQEGHDAMNALTGKAGRVADAVAPQERAS